MGLLENLIFEVERRVVLYKSTTTMPDGSVLGYNGNPNSVSSGGTPGEYLIFAAPTGSRYQENDGTQWYKKSSPNVWSKFGDGTGGAFSGGTIPSSIYVSGDTKTTSQFISEVTGSTSPIVVNSAALVKNLNVEFLGGYSADGLVTKSNFENYTGNTTTILNNKLNSSGGTIANDLTVSGTIYGDGSGLTHIPASGITDLNQLTYSGKTAILTNTGLTVNTDVIIDGYIDVNSIKVDSNILVNNLNANYLNGTSSSGFTNINIFNSHTGNTSNPHNVTASQIGVYTTGETTNLLSGKSNTGHTHYQLYQPNGSNPFVYTDNGGNLHIDGNIMQSGTTYETHAQQIYSSSDYIYLRSGATGSLSVGEYSGVEVMKVDGVNDARIVFDRDGVGRLGINGDEKPIVVSDELTGMTGNSLTYWSESEQKLKVSDLTITNINNKFLNSTGGTINGDITITGKIYGDASGLTGLPTGGTSINGGVFITDIIPTTTGNISNKIKTTDGYILDSFVTDTQNVKVIVYAITGTKHYKPRVTVNSNNTIMSIVGNGPLFTGYTNMILYNTTGLTATHEDGSSHTTIVNYESIPVVTSAKFAGNYPGSQTELKAGDTFNVSVITDVDVSTIEFYDYGAFSAQTFSVSGGTENIVTCVVTSRTTGTYGAKLRVRKSNGSVSSDFIISGTTDKVNSLKLNNTYPSISISSITYPNSQSALKNSESAIINHTISNYDTVLYEGLLSQISVTGSTTYNPTLTVTRIGGGYNISTNNVKITATKSSNNSVTIGYTTVKIANTTPTITITGATSRLISGGNDNTAVQNYTITMISDQDILGTPTMESPLSNFTGSWTKVSNTTYTRTLQVSDNMARGTYFYSNILITNLAGIQVTNVVNNNFVIGGFVSRTITSTVPNQDTFVINVDVSDYSKVPSTLNWSFKTLTIKSSAGTDTGLFMPLSWCIDEYNTSNNRTLVKILDTAAVNSATNVGYTIIINEPS